MTEEQLSQIKRRNAEEILAAIPAGSVYERRLAAAIEAAMNEEWWRGYHAGRRSEQTHQFRQLQKAFE